MRVPVLAPRSEMLSRSGRKVQPFQGNNPQADTITHLLDACQESIVTFYNITQNTPNLPPQISLKNLKNLLT